MNDEDFDIQQFAKLFDAALASDNPAVKKALRNFMMVASITEAEYAPEEQGPLTRLLDLVDSMERRLKTVEHELKNESYAKQMARGMSKDYSWDQYTTTGTWPSSVTTGYKSNNFLDYDIDYLSKVLNKGTP